MTIQFERRTDRPDAAGRCTIYRRTCLDGQWPRFATRKECLPAEFLLILINHMLPTV